MTGVRIPSCAQWSACFVAIASLLLAACAPTTQKPATAPPTASACKPAPFDEDLYLRGTMTTWVPREDLVFHYVCDAYFLNVDLHGEHDIRVTGASLAHVNLGVRDGVDSSIKPGVAIAMTQSANGGLHSARFAFNGEQTLRLEVSGADAKLTIGPKTFHDPTEVAIDDKVAKSLRFDSRDVAFKKPYGAVTATTAVDFTLRADRGVQSATMVIEKRRIEGPQEVLEYTEVVREPMTRSEQSDGDAWHVTHRFDEIGVYGFYFLVKIDGKDFVYQNNADPIYWTREVGSNGVGVVTNVPEPRRIRRFRQTVFRSDFAVPEWARDVVYYYIFPERFRNGDPKNDPKPGPHTFWDRSVEVHKNWLDKPFKPHTGDGSDDLYSNDFFGGDLAGIIQKLDYIHDLGANALYLTPIFHAASNHKYDTADYEHIDPHFGDNALFERLTREAKKRGIRIVLDTSLNHTGSDSIYFNRYGNYPDVGAFNNAQVHPESKYASWYHFDATQTDPDKEYHGWGGVGDLPELIKSEPSYREFAFGGPHSVMKQWLDRGASGWRMDVVPWISDDFWRAWRSAIKEHKPDALTVAEAQFESSKFFLGDEFDSTMNYVFRDAVQAYAAGDDARAAYQNIELIRETYPPQTFYALMNLLSTHDTARALFDFGYRNDNDSAETIATAKARLHLAAFFQMIFPGSPAIFYGDEVGVTGGDDPYNRVTYPWADVGGKPDTALLADYKRMVAMRHANPVLRHGSIDAPAYLDAHVIVLIRRDGETWAVTATNNANDAQKVEVTLPKELNDASFVDAMSKTKSVAKGTALSLNVPPMSGVVLVRK